MFQPTTFGQYFLTKRLAIGGMAEVYAAKLYGADGFEKDLVIKQILPQYAKDPEFVQSFVAEAKIAVGLSHANIVGIHELGRVEGTYFIAMELVDGLDVFGLIDAAKRHGAALTPADALFVVEEVAKGLDYAHRKAGPDGTLLGLVHRDLSPRNVLVSREGEVKILDFGIAKIGSAVAGLMPKTRAGVVKGTTGYMSPEQATGLEVDARTDVYQAGLLLYELLTQEALFWRPDDDETRTLMQRHELIAPSQKVPGLPPEIDQTFFTALARDPLQRFQNARDLATLLGRQRAAFYPEHDPRRLGALVGALLDLESGQEAESSGSLPSTQELSGALDRLGATSGSPPSLGWGAGAAEDSKAARPWLEEGLIVAGPVPSADPVYRFAGGSSGSLAHPRPMARRMLAAAAAALALTAAAGIGAWVAPGGGGVGRRPSASRDLRDGDESQTSLTLPTIVLSATAAPAPLPARDPPSVLDRPRASAARDAMFDPAEPASAVIDPAEPAAAVLDPQSTPSTAWSGVTGAAGTPANARSAGSRLPFGEGGPHGEGTPHHAQGKPGAGEAVVDATVSFGTRSCSSRVTIDDEVVARSTPSYDQRLSPGRHRIRIDGTNCRPVERPGSLGATVPSVSGEVDVGEGAALKIIADFERGELLVRKR